MFWICAEKTVLIIQRCFHYC